MAKSLRDSMVTIRALVEQAVDESITAAREQSPIGVSALLPLSITLGSILEEVNGTLQTLPEVIVSREEARLQLD